MAKIPYYTLRRRGDGKVQGYWQPTKTMREAGFVLVPCGEDGPAARAVAHEWNARWQAHRGRNDWRTKKTPPSKDFGYAYFLCVGNRVKIGFSQDPFARVNNLRTGLAQKVDVVVAFQATRMDEGRLHRRLKAYRQEGEWFAMSETVRKIMCRCAAMGVDAIAEIQDQNENLRPSESDN